MADDTEILKLTVDTSDIDKAFERAADSAAKFGSKVKTAVDNIKTIDLEHKFDGLGQSFAKVSTAAADMAQKFGSHFGAAGQLIGSLGATIVSSATQISTSFVAVGKAAQAGATGTEKLALAMTALRVAMGPIGLALAAVAAVVVALDKYTGGAAVKMLDMKTAMGATALEMQRLQLLGSATGLGFERIADAARTAQSAIRGSIMELRNYQEQSQLMKDRVANLEESIAIRGKEREIARERELGWNESADRKQKALDKEREEHEDQQQQTMLERMKTRQSIFEREAQAQMSPATRILTGGQDLSKISKESFDNIIEGANKAKTSATASLDLIIGKIKELKTISEQAGVAAGKQGAALFGAGDLRVLEQQSGAIHRFATDSAGAINQTAQEWGIMTAKQIETFAKSREAMARAVNDVDDFAKNSAAKLAPLEEKLTHIRDLFKAIPGGAPATAGTAPTTAGEHQSGGYISGPGSGTSDSILARLSNGEFVMSAAAVQRHGRGFMERLNRFQEGGHVSGAALSYADQAEALYNMDADLEKQGYHRSTVTGRLIDAQGHVLSDDQERAIIRRIAAGVRSAAISEWLGAERRREEKEQRQQEEEERRDQEQRRRRNVTPQPERVERGYSLGGLVDAFALSLPTFSGGGMVDIPSPAPLHPLYLSFNGGGFVGGMTANASAMDQLSRQSVLQQASSTMRSKPSWVK